MGKNRKSSFFPQLCHVFHPKNINETTNNACWKQTTTRLVSWSSPALHGTYATYFIRKNTPFTTYKLGPLPVIDGVLGPPINGRKYMGNWGDFTPNKWSIHLVGGPAHLVVTKYSWTFWSAKVDGITLKITAVEEDMDDNLHLWFHRDQGTRTGVRTVHVRVLPWYLLCSTSGFLGIITRKYPLYRAYIGISHGGTLVGVHPTIPWVTSEQWDDYSSLQWSIIRH